MQFLNNLFNKKYKAHPEAIVLSCFYNPQNNYYRNLAFQKFYNTIKHLNHKIVECAIGNENFQLKRMVGKNANIVEVRTPTLLWHKESLLNNLIKSLPKEIKYVFWVDADVLFANKNWLTDGVKKMKNGAKVIQPFEYCIHLEKNKITPQFNVEKERKLASAQKSKSKPKRMWRSFCSNPPSVMIDERYDVHGHVGFAWGAQREVLNACPLYSKALVGGADHIIAHAAVGHIPHHCIQKSFFDNIEDIEKWSKNFFDVVRGNIGYVPGDLYHIWHGDIEKRQYLTRIQDFTKISKDIVNTQNGLYVANDEQEQYVKNYMKYREVEEIPNTYEVDDGFFNDDIPSPQIDTSNNVVFSFIKNLFHPIDVNEEWEKMIDKIDLSQITTIKAEADDPNSYLPIEQKAEEENFS